MATLVGVLLTLGGDIALAGGGGLTWAPPVDVSAPGQDSFLGDVSGTHEGAVAAWVVSDATTQSIEAATFNGSAWSAPAEVAPAAEEYNNLSVSGTNAGAVATWAVDSGSGFVTVQASVFDGTTWSAPVDISAAGVLTVAGTVDGDNHGAIVAMQRPVSGGVSIVQAVTFDGAAWSPVADVSPPGEFALLGTQRGASVISGTNLGAIITWWWPNNPAGASIRSATFDGVTWSAPLNVSIPNGVDSPTLGEISGSNAGAVAVWKQGDDGVLGGAESVKASTFDGATWAAPVDISGPGFGPFARIVGTNAGAVAAWKIGTTSEIVQAATFNGTTWSSPATLFSDPDGVPGVPDVDGAPAGATVVWSVVPFSGTSDEGVIEASSFDGVAWSAAIGLTAPGENSAPQVVDPSGALAVWQGSDGTNLLVRSSLGTLDGPPTANPVIPVVATPRTTG